MHDPFQMTLRHMLTWHCLLNVNRTADALSLQELRSKCVSFVMDEFPPVLQSANSLDLHTHLVSELLASDSIANCEESHLLRWLLRWLCHNQDDRTEDFVTQLLPLIRFPLIHDLPTLLQSIKSPDLSTPSNPLLKAIVGTAEAQDGQRANPRRKTCHLRLCRLLEGHTKAVSAIHFFEGLLLSGSWDETLRVWRLDDKGDGSYCRWKCVQVLHGHSRSVLSIKGFRTQEQGRTGPRSIMSGRK